MAKHENQPASVLILRKENLVALLDSIAPESALALLINRRLSLMPLSTPEAIKASVQNDNWMIQSTDPNYPQLREAIAGQAKRTLDRSLHPPRG